MGSSTVKSAERTLEVLSYLSAQSGPVLAATISRNIGLPKSSTYHLLNVMLDRSFVSYFPEERGWALGPVAREIGLGQPKRDALERASRSILGELATRTKETALLAIEHGTEIVVLNRHDAPGEPLNGVPVTGMRVPAHLSAYGRALLMSEPETRVRAMFPATGPLPVLVGRGPRDRVELLQILASASEAGFACDRSETHRSTASVAVPVFDHIGFVVASIGVTYWSASRDARATAELAIAVRTSAAQLSRRLGWRDRAEAC